MRSHLKNLIGHIINYCSTTNSTEENEKNKHTNLIGAHKILGFMIIKVEAYHKEKSQSETFTKS